MGVSFKSKTTWDGVVEKMEIGLASWKKIYLTRGGHLNLVKSRLFGLPMYFLVTFHFMSRYC